MIQTKIRPIKKQDDAEVGHLIKTVLTEFKANKPGTAYYDDSTNHLSTLFVNTCELVKLYLHPTARGKGLGRDLMFKCFDKAKELGYENIYLESMPELNQAVSLYEKIGFNHLGCSLGNSGHFGCDIWMVKKL